MKQNRYANSFQNDDQKNVINTSILKHSLKQNLNLSKIYSNNTDNQKNHINEIELISLEKSLRSVEQQNTKLKKEIYQLKSQLEENKEYTTALQQKYMILLQSVQPAQQRSSKFNSFKTNFQSYKRVKKVPHPSDSQNSQLFILSKLQSQKNTSIVSEVEILQETTASQQVKSIIRQSSDIEKSNILIEDVQIGKESCKNVRFSENVENQESHKKLQNSQFSQRKSRKTSTQSDIGIQVCFTSDFEHLSIKKDNLQKYLSLQQNTKSSTQTNILRKRKNSQFQQNLSSVWSKFINQFLQNEQLSTKFKFKTQYLITKCIPSQLRSTVWPLVFQNNLAISRQFYMELLQRKSNGWVDESVKIQIDKDLHRSFTGKGKQIQNKDKLIDQVRQVLELFHIYRPDISYVQGMTYPAIILTTIVGKMKAFTILSNQIVGIPFFKRLYTFESNYPVLYCKTFQLLLKDVNSNCYQLLKKKKIHSQIFLIEWFYTFFSRGLSFQTILKIWDHFAYFGEVIIFKVAVTVLQMVYSHLIDANQQQAMALIKEFSSYVDEKKLYQAFINSKVTDQRYKKAYRKAIKSQQTRK